MRPGGYDCHVDQSVTESFLEPEEVVHVTIGWSRVKCCSMATIRRSGPSMMKSGRAATTEAKHLETPVELEPEQSSVVSANTRNIGVEPFNRFRALHRCERFANAFRTFDSDGRQSGHFVIVTCKNVSTKAVRLVQPNHLCACLDFRLLCLHMWPRLLDVVFNFALSGRTSIDDVCRNNWCLHDWHLRWTASGIRCGWHPVPTWRL
jgi:hypothetical protein